MSIKATPHKYSILYILLSTTLSTLMLLSACGPREIELPFETIEQSNYSPRYEERKPGLVIIANEDEIDQLTGFVTPRALSQLQELDYDKYFAVVAFLGWHHKVHEGIRIERIIRQNNLVFIHAQVGELTGKDAISSPYHIVKVQKVGRWGTEIDFSLVIDKDIVASQSHYIP